MAHISTVNHSIAVLVAVPLAYTELGLAVLVAALGVGAIVSAWAHRKPRLLTALMVIACVIVCWGLVGHAQVYQVYCEGAWYWLNGCFLL
jgi:putative effector of murein hydrolase LrgA (UPF0299 family)